MTPHLDDAAGEHFTFRDLCEVGETWQRIKIANAPAEPATYDALRRLTTTVLDPLTRALGRPVITYGFCGLGLGRHIKERVAPRLDQHAGHELRASGGFICDRLGQAVDLQIPGLASSEVAQFIARGTPFDRLYFYGDDRPLHVSVGPSDLRAIVLMMRGPSGRLIPRKAPKHHFDAP